MNNAFTVQNLRRLKSTNQLNQEVIDYLINNYDILKSLNQLQHDLRPNMSQAETIQFFNSLDPLPVEPDFTVALRRFINKLD